MRGLNKYIRKYGRHINLKLADVLYNSKWNASDIEKTTQEYVYYNVTSTTLGDMVYITNMVHYHKGWNKRKCIKHTLSIVEDYPEGKEYAFTHLLTILKLSNQKVDFSKYI